ncbi:BspA family leucine-rich repeat surface protein [Marinicella meishanensis]|uniref:BspA family leucine-rich repeat surface protein n=1 Tax=Marinicella meishanensis TaxID=2873263 RepID=UPI001CBACF07|nr:BspA family leucine-rich repeat surface protein [Marinicella sp. NBU2979]
MKQWTLYSILFFLAATAAAVPADDFVITVQTDAPDTSEPDVFRITTAGAGYDFNVDCNDDGVDEASSLTGDYVCDYSGLGGPGVYTIRIKDNSGMGTGFPRFLSYPAGHYDNADKLLSVDQWGTGLWSSMERAFASATHLEVLATDVPNLTGVSSLSEMFWFARSVNPNVSAWDVSTVTDLSGMFRSASGANPNVSNWDVSAVTDMSELFAYANQANPDVSSWDVSSVTDMSAMFLGSWQTNSLANPDVSAWDVSSVTDMSLMFADTGSANPDVSHWNVASVTNMTWMFYNAAVADPDVSTWDVSSVTDMPGMFARVGLADPDVSDWDVSSVENMSHMFQYNNASNPDVSQWDVSSVNDMSRMFQFSSADPEVGSWDVSAVSHFFLMFYGAEMANPDVSLWDVSAAVDMEGMFLQAHSATPDMSNWTIPNVINMTYMLGEVTLPTELYDAILLNFASQSVQANVEFDAGDSFFCRQAVARNVLINQQGWRISDLGQDCAGQGSQSVPVPVDDPVMLVGLLLIMLLVAGRSVRRGQL